MKISMKKRIPLILALTLMLTIFSAGCGQTAHQTESQTEGTESAAPSASGSQDTVQASENGENTGAESTVQGSSATDLIVRFGDDGEAFTLHLYDNETAAAIARHVGTTDWIFPAAMRFRPIRKALPLNRPEQFTIPNQTASSCFIRMQRFPENIRW